MDENLSREGIKMIIEKIQKLVDEINKIAEKRDLFVNNLQNIANTMGCGINEEKLIEITDKFQSEINAKTDEIMKIQKPLDLFEKIY